MRRVKPLLLVLLLAACGPDEPAAQPASAAARTETPRQVRVISPEQGELTNLRRVSVTVEAELESMVASGANGRVARIVAPAGTTVQAGDPVIELDADQARFQADAARLQVEAARVNLQSARNASAEGGTQAAAALQSARLGLDLQQRLYDEAVALHAAGAIASAELQGLEAQLSQARLQVQQAQDAVNRAGRAGGEDLTLLELQVSQAETQLQQAEAQLAETQISAPFAGEVAQVFVNPGEFAGAGSPAFRLIGTGPRLARFSVTTEEAAELAGQETVIVTYGGQQYEARLRPASAVPGQARLVSLTAEIDQGIPVGAVAELEFQTTLGSGLVLPVSALRGGNSVLAVEGDRATQLPVGIVAEAGGRAVVTGVEADTRVISPLPADLQPGALVNVVTGSAGQ